VLGNLKLTFRAVQQWHPAARFADDLIGECQLVLLKAVAAFNPWMGVRFSTYAFTCLTRALSRLVHRQAADRLTRSLPLAVLGAEEDAELPPEEPCGPAARLSAYFGAEHGLLTAREKTVLIRRYCAADGHTETLEEVGRALGLSKERVRQVQSVALGKLREVLLAEAGSG
jgi:RNA polymerase sigma factor (sigma-70 family)